MRFLKLYGHPIFVTFLILIFEVRFLLAKFAKVGVIYLRPLFLATNVKNLGEKAHAFHEKDPLGNSFNNAVSFGFSRICR